MVTMSVLVVEDDVRLAQSLVKGFRAAGFNVELAYTAEAAMTLWAKRPPDLVVLDLTLPDMSGLELLGHWQSRSSTPVIVVSARTELQARLASFDRGAVDYLPKPFWMEELLARVKSRLKLVASTPHQTLTFDDLTIDFDQRTVTRGQVALPLTKYEFNILALLVRREGASLSRQQLADAALGSVGSVMDRTVDSHVARIRKKLGASGTRIVTAWGVGYRFESERDAG
jgi:two-component system, OmpR family, response regulator